MPDHETLAELARRRGFFFPAARAYGGVAGFHVLGPAGASLKRNVIESWRERFVVREGHTEVDAPTVLPEAVFEASGHTDHFADALVACPECDRRHRADHLIEDATGVDDAESLSADRMAALLADAGVDCPDCGAALASQDVVDFDLMFETNVGPGDAERGYLRPETAQATLVEFPRLKEYARGELPFGVAQVGRAYRNEISPRKSLLRVREMTQAELQHFVDPDRDDPPLSRVADVPLTLAPAPAASDPDGDASRTTAAEAGEAADGASAATAENTRVETTVAEAVADGVVDHAWLAYYLGVAREWYERIGVDPDRLRFRQHRRGELAHYAEETWDAEADVSAPGDPAEWIELAGIAYRADNDLARHADGSGEDYTVFRQYDEPRRTERATVDPDMSYLGPRYGERAPAVVDALADLAAREPAAFEGETVAVAVDGETVEVPVDRTCFAVEEVTEAGEHVRPHVVEPAMGVERAVYAALAHAYREDEVDGETRTVLALDPAVAPTLAAVLPLVDDDGLPERARDVAADLRAAGLSVDYDDAGSVGRRYRRQDEVGTPYCVTVDHRTLEDDTVTVRDRDTTAQVRVPATDLAAALADLGSGDVGFEALADDG